MSEVSTMERVIRSDVSMEECKKIEKVLRKNNISYFERWKLHTGLLRFLKIYYLTTEGSFVPGGLLTAYKITSTDATDVNEVEGYL